MTYNDVKPAIDCWSGKLDCETLDDCKAAGCPFAKPDGKDCSVEVIETLGAMLEGAGTVSADKVSVHRSICEELNSLYDRKNHDYGDSFGSGFKQYGMTMPVIRLEDKLNRLKSLINAPAQVDESIDDTLMDLANYSIMTLIERKL